MATPLRIPLVGLGVATIEETGVMAIPGAGTLSGTTTENLGYSPFPRRLVQFGVDYGGTAVTASDVDYWSVALIRRQYFTGTQTTIATKTTKTTASGGEAIGANVPWIFDASVFDLNAAVFDDRDMLRVVWTKNGVAPNVTTPRLYVMRFEAVQ